METDTQTCTEERDQDGKVQMFTTAHVQQGFPGGSESKESACTARDPGSIPGLGRSPGGGHGIPLQYSCVENPYGQRSMVGCSTWGCKESDTTERLSTRIQK